MKQYVIKVAQGKKVELTIEDLAIEACEDCSCDRLEIYDTPATGYPTILDVSKAFLYMTHSQMLGKFEYTLPAKF